LSYTRETVLERLRSPYARCGSRMP